MTSPSVPVADRFWLRVDRGDDKGGDCWLWTGTIGTKGYPLLYTGLPDRYRLASRVAWELTYGAIPAGLFVCHACDNPLCVRPDHLMLGSARANKLDSSRKGRANKGAKTHCKRGHKFTPDNVYSDPRGQRGCKRCRWEARRRVAGYTHLTAADWERASARIDEALGG